MKVLLEYEEISLHLQYNAKKEFFLNSVYPPNPECKDRFCLQRQQEKAGKLGFLGKRKETIKQKLIESSKPIEQNKEEIDKWGIELVENDKSEDQSTKVHTITKEETEGQSLDSLMDQFNKL